jgi:virginiamycin A acetyltransferase
MQSAFQNRYGFKKSHVFKGDVVIGNNVWIGDNAIILPGVKIGNGAVIAAGSVVTCHVPSYAIFGGNPAKLIKYRFDESKRRILDKIDWWNWDTKKVLEHRDLFNVDINEIDEKTLIRFAGGLRN